MEGFDVAEHFAYAQEGWVGVGSQTLGLAAGHDPFRYFVKIRRYGSLLQLAL
jgi:hypothetical protein